MSMFGRIQPQDLDHLAKHPLTLYMPSSVATVERTLSYPAQLTGWYNQGQMPACVGYSSSWLSSINNGGVSYDAKWLYAEAQKIDGIPGPHDGTTVRAAMDVLRKVGHVRVIGGVDQPASQAEGILRNAWAVTVDQVRASISDGVPVVFGINWYNNFTTPVIKRGVSWIGTKKNLGRVVGGHAICCIGASDRRQAVLLLNSWGASWEPSWLPYSVVTRLLNEGGEAAVVVDRPNPAGADRMSGAAWQA